MKNSLKFGILLVVLLLKSVAYTQTIPEGMGFYSEDSGLLPSLVKQAAKSVFRLAVPAGKQVTVAQLFNGKSTADAITFVSGLDQSKISKTDKLIYLYQLNMCAKNPTQTCTLFEGVEQGTGFVVDDGTKMFTAYHVIKAVAAIQPLPIFIIGSNEELVYSPDTIALTVESIGKTGTPTELNPNVQSKVQDIATLKASVKIAKPLNPAIETAQAGSKVYLAGFPMPTNDRKKFGALDSDGISKYFSVGHILSSEEVKHIAQKNFGGAPVNLLNELLNNLVISSADGAPGLSGAPTLNEAGKYLGIFTSGAPQYEAAVERLSYSTPVQ